MPVRPAWLIIAALTAGMALCHAGTAGAAGAKPAIHTVVIEAVKFTPAVMTVNRGDVVVWVNKDPIPHTATAPHGAFDSHSIAAGGSWKFIARHKGEFAYICTLHPSMQGTLIVK